MTQHRNPVASRRSRRRHRAPRLGFTLIELMVALILLDVALLGLVAASAASARHLAAARLQARVAAAAASRLEQAAASPCSAGASMGTTALAPGVQETWLVSAPVGDTRLVRDSVEAHAPWLPQHYVFVSRAPC